MKNAFFVLIILLFSQNGFAKVSWHYTAFPHVEKNSKIKLSEPEALRVGKKVLYPLMSRQSGTHRYWRVEQLFLSKDLKKKVFVKYKVGLSSKDPLGGWVKLKKAHVLHLQKGKDVVAYMAQGFNNLELYELQKQLSQSSKKVSEIFWNPFMDCAHAEVTSNPAGDGWGYSEEQWTAPESTESSVLERAANVAKCVGGETLGKVADAGKKLWENATLENAWEAVPSKEEIKNGALAAWNAIPTWEETKQGASAAWNTVTNLDPEAVVEGISKAWDHTTQLIAGIYQKVKEIVAGFANLTAEIADYLICQITTHLIQKGSMNAAMAVLTGGGAIAVAMAKMTTSILDFANKLNPNMPVFLGLSKSPLSSAEKLEKAEKIMKGEMSKDEMERLAGDVRAPAGEGIVAANAAGQTVEGQMKAIRELSPVEKDAMLKVSGSLNDKERVTTAASALGRPLSKKESEALLRAHNVAPERGYKTYTKADLSEKTRILREAGYSQKEADLLMRKGLAGQIDETGSISYAGIRQTYLEQNAGINASYGTAPRLDPDVSMGEVPFFAEKIRESLKNGATRPATVAEGTRLGEILLRDFARTAKRGSDGKYAPGKDQTEALQKYLGQLGYPVSPDGMGWPLSSPGTMEALLRFPASASPTYLNEKKATGLLAVGQISNRISILNNSIARRGLGISEADAQSEIRVLMEQRNQIDKLFGIIDSQTSK